MLKAYHKDTGLLYVGLTQGNIDRLIAGRPLVLSPLPSAGPVAATILVYGKTKPDIIFEIEAHTNFRFEESHKQAAKENPE